MNKNLPPILSSCVISSNTLFLAMAFRGFFLPPCCDKGPKASKDDVALPYFLINWRKVAGPIFSVLKSCNWFIWSFVYVIYIL